MTPNLGFGLYIHWPFCQSKCPYCDFNSHVAASIDQFRWRKTYLSEIERMGIETSGRVLESIYFGGGTPSLMDPALVAAILEKVFSTWQRSNDIEVTLEANPTSVEAARFAAYHDAGINRVSIGVQALQDAALVKLGRMHNVQEALRAIDIANTVFSRVNFDLIYARQDQSLTEWRDELQLALKLGSSHLSLYQLTVEEGTVFHQRNARGQLLGLPQEDLAADMFDLTQELCSADGVPAYEVSNHARFDQESRHNLVYWRGGDYMGIGPGAHGRLTIDGNRTATEAIRLPSTWLEAVEQRGTGEVPRSILSPEDAGSEYLLMGLRLKEGILLPRYRTLTGRDLAASKIADLASLGYVAREADRLRVTDRGTLVLNAILRDLLAG